MIRYKKVGGLRFIRVLRFQFSWCVCRRPTITKKLRDVTAVEQGPWTTPRSLVMADKLLRQRAAYEGGRTHPAPIYRD